MTLLAAFILTAFFVAFIIAVFLGMYALRQSRNFKAKLFVALCLAIATWALTFCGQNLAATAEAAKLWRRVSTLGWGSTYTFILHLALVLSDSRLRPRKLTALLLYVPAILTIFSFGTSSTLTNTQFTMVKISIGWGVVSTHTFWEYFFILYYISYSALTIYCFITWGRKATNSRDKKAASFIVFALTTAFVAGTVTDQILPNFTPFQIPSLAPIFIILPLISFFYAIHSGSLIDIETTGSDRSSTILTERTILAFANYFSLVLILTAFFVFISIFIRHSQPERALFWGAFDVILGALLLPFAVLPISAQGRELVLCSTSALFMVVNAAIFHRLGLTNTAWIIPILILIPITLISQSQAFWVTIVSALATVSLYFVLEFHTTLIISRVVFIIRIISLSLAFFLTWKISQIWTARQHELDSQVRFQHLLSSIADFFNQPANSDSHKLTQVLEQVRTHYHADSCHFEAGPAEKGVQTLTLSGLKEGTEKNQAFQYQLDIIEKKIDAALESDAFNKSIHQMARYDQITGLPKRVIFNQDIAKTIKRAQENSLHFTLLHINIDSFREINNTAGFTSGDQLLRLIAEELREVVSTEGTIYYFGGDDFLILGNGHQDEQLIMSLIQNKTDLIMAARKKTVAIRGHDFFVSLSIGAAVYPQHGEDSDTLLKHANLALFQAKRQGRNKFCFYSTDLQNDSFKKLTMTYNLQRAVENNSLYLVYQPQTDVASGEVIAFEALLRWKDAEYGQVPPDVFIPLAEQSGLIEMLGSWVILEACRQLAVWQARSAKKYRMGINLSPRQLYTDDIVGVVRDAIAVHGLDAKYVDLEITEGIAIKKYDQIVSVMHQLKNLGVEISIDDFGSEYASLLRLKSLPVDRLKIDMYYIRNLSDDDAANATVKAMIYVGKQLGLKVLAEGVETAAHLAFLQAQHCDEYQGYFKSKPLSPAEIEAAFMTPALP